MALVRIYNAGMKFAARGSLQIEGPKKVAKNRHLGTIPQLCRAISLQLRHVLTIGKKLLAKLRRSTDGATYIWQGGHHVGHWPTFLVMAALRSRCGHYIFAL